MDSGTWMDTSQLTLPFSPSQVDCPRLWLAEVLEPRMTPEPAPGSSEQAAPRPQPPGGSCGAPHSAGSPGLLGFG